MISTTLFEVKEENLETGLRGYPVGYCTTSAVDPVKGIFYRNQSIAELAHKQPEEVIYLLYYGCTPSENELVAFKKELQERSICKKELLDQICLLPKVCHPMQLLSCALLLASAYESVQDYREDGLNIIAKIPTIVAVCINFHAGWGGIAPPKPELGYVENFAHMLRVPNASLAELTQALKLFAVLHFDHGGGNLSTFVGKAVASSLEDMYGSMAAAMCALAGARHGRANQDCLEFIQEVSQSIGSPPTIEAVRELLEKRLAAGGLILGFGHAVLRVEDPRAQLFFQELERRYPDHPLTTIVSLIRQVGTEVLKKNPKISNPYPNVDLVSGTLLVASGFAYSEYFTVLFGWARVVGIAIQIVYERCQARGGKGTPIVRPKYIYKSL